MDTVNPIDFLDILSLMIDNRLDRMTHIESEMSGIQRDSVIRHGEFPIHIVYPVYSVS